MKIAIAGITGFVGGSLAIHMSKKGHEIVSVRREHFDLSTNKLAQYLEGCKAVYNFSGAPVIKRWTKKYKAEIKASRILTTRKLVEAMGLMKTQPEFFFNASAIGYYDYVHRHTENSLNKGKGFLSKVVALWEKEAGKATSLNIRTVIGRIGVVLDRKHGALPQLIKPYMFGMGGMIGFGKQAVSFIHGQDLIRALDYLLEDKNAKGVYNLVAPSYCTNREMSQIIGILLNKPAFLRIPYFLIYLLYGQSAEIIRGGEKVVPLKLEKSDFEFNFPDIYSSLTDLI